MSLAGMCVLYQIYKSRHRRLHANYAARNNNNNQSQSPQLIALTDEEILQRQVEHIERASKRRQQILHRFEKDHTIMVRFLLQQQSEFYPIGSASN